MEKVTLTQNEILIVQCEKNISPLDLELTREKMKEQAKEGVVMIPPGFSHSILKNNIVTIECGGQNIARK